MTPAKALRTKTFTFLVLMVCFGAAGDVLLSKGMKQVGAVTLWSPTALFDVFFSAFTSTTIWLGILSLIGFFICYLLVLSWADFSYVLPASAASYAVVALLGYALLGERVSAVRWSGVALICVGVGLVGRTPPNTTTIVPPAIPLPIAAKADDDARVPPAGEERRR